jgi:basic membrane protein A
MKARNIRLITVFMALVMFVVFSPVGLSKSIDSVGVVYSLGGRGDKGFNDLVYIGAKKAADEFDLKMVDIEPGQLSNTEPSLRALAEQGLDIIIAIGFTSTEYVKNVAQDFPNTKFALVDGVVDLPNVASLLFKEHEGSFLVGAIAGMMTKTDIVGFVGGMESDLIRKFEVGYKEGVHYVNSDARVLVGYAGVTGEAFRDPAKGHELALSQYAQGADIIFHASGTTGFGVIDAAEEEGKYAIGVDTNQNYVAPGSVLTSMLKRADVAAYDIVKAAVNGNYNGGIRVYGLKEGGVGFVVDKYNKDLLPQKVIDRANEIREKIIKGEIKVTNVMNQ